MEKWEIIYELSLWIAIVAIGVAVVGWWTAKGRSFRSSRNRKARRQF